MFLAEVCQSAAIVLIGLAALFWIAAGLALGWGQRRIRSLADAPPRPDAELPSLTLIATAKDEEARVEDAARSLLAQDYPGVRVLIVDDRSSDRTGAILERLARDDPRLRVLHIEALPPGWIGKCHALASAAPSAGTEWLLFTDGDVVLAPDTARRAVSFALRERADHVAVGPDLEVGSLSEAVFVGYFVVMFHLSERPWSAEDPRSSASIGIGAFNLVRREVYERSGGHARIRFDLLDDLALGKILKESGARQIFAHHGGRVRARWHVGARGHVRGVEKNAFAAFHYRPVTALLAVAAQLSVALAPVAGLFLPGAARAVALTAWAGVVLAYIAASRSVSIRPWQAVLMPLGGVLFSYAILRSTWLALARGGVVWRGTFYSLEELRKGRVW